MKSRRMTWFHKLKVCLYFLDIHKNNGVVSSCSFCDSARIIILEEGVTKESVDVVHYKATNKCMDCGAIGEVKEIWRKGG